MRFRASTNYFDIENFCQKSEMNVFVVVYITSIHLSLDTLTIFHRLEMF